MRAGQHVTKVGTDKDRKWKESAKNVKIKQTETGAVIFEAL